MYWGIYILPFIKLEQEKFLFFLIFRLAFRQSRFLHFQRLHNIITYAEHQSSLIDLQS